MKEAASSTLRPKVPLATSSIQEHMAGTARVAEFHAGRALDGARCLVRRMESGRAHSTDYKETEKAIKEAQDLLQFLVRLQHAVIVREHIGRSDVLLGMVAACKRRKARARPMRGVPIAPACEDLLVPKVLLEKVETHLGTFSTSA
ncbi:hypothetical protein [Ottowia sp.]|uniref:hypothetical protein n=1 Tax=Ottowia sp. TaxID=1898956 RepID=UPI0025F9B046|nr:hypothetical protein [Ottowia sp.]MBK6616501.1 hypothetical protein [Ottowia sp.]